LKHGKVDRKLGIARKNYENPSDLRLRIVHRDSGYGYRSGVITKSSELGFTADSQYRSVVLFICWQR
jgi:hypothetical protein